MEHLIGFEGLGIDPFIVNKVAFSIGSVNIYWYAILITAGLLLAILFGMWQAKRFDLSPDNVIDVCLFGLPAALIGARLYYVLFTLDRYDSFAEMLNIRDGGLAIYGGIIAAFLTGFIYCKIKKIPMLALFDLGALGFAIGQGVGRWGNFMNAEAYGEITTLPWGMTIDGRGPYHPTFFYESVWCLLGFALLFFFSRKLKKMHGEVFFLYLIWYGIGRFFIEGLRTDSLYLGEIRISQLLSAVLVLCGLVFYILLRSGILNRWEEKHAIKQEAKQGSYTPIYTPLVSGSNEPRLDEHSEEDNKEKTEEQKTEEE